MRRLSLMRLATLVRSNVDHQLSPSGRSRESGAVASIVAILFGTGVLLGLGALVIDTGSLLYERRQLQSGADAAALSLAWTCVKAPSSAPCAAPDASALLALTALAGKNAADQRSDVAGVCGSAAVVAANPTGGWTLCPDWQATSPPPDPGLVECPKTSAAGGKYVEVRTSTRTATSNILPPFLAQMLVGGSYKGETVKACARAGYGASGPHPLLPFAFSACEWWHDTVNGTVYAPFLPAGSNKNDPYEHAVDLNSASDAGCDTWQNHISPGGFGWLDYDPTTCKLADPILGLAHPDAVAPEPKAALWWYPGDTGVGAGNQCGAKIEAAVGTVVYLPVFQCADDDRRREPCAGNVPNGTNVWYRMQGAAAFYLTGVDITGQLSYSLPGYPKKTAKDECKADASGNKKCLYGWFLQDLVDPVSGLDGDGTDLGLKGTALLG